MKKLSVKEIAGAVCGRLNNEEFGSLIVNKVSTDTRKDVSGSLFVPLKGQSFDGHDYISAAFEKGAVCSFSEVAQNGEKPVIYVLSVKEALKKLAEYYRGLFDVKVVAVTGSSGKTTTKDLIASVLSKKYNTLKTSGNFNNEIGLPLTIFKMADDVQVVVLEMGMSEFGEISSLSKVARPDLAVITNIGDAHIETLGSRENILKAKCEIFDHMDQDGIAFLNGDDILLQQLKGTRKNMYYFGTENTNTFYPTNVKYKGLSGVSYIMNGIVPPPYGVNVPLPGYHMVLDSLAAAGIGEMMGLSPAEISSGIEEFKPSDMRMDILHLDGNVTVINDAYNANPGSVKASLDVLAAVGGRRICVLGDMLELGVFSPSLHYEVGLYAAESCIDMIVCIGYESRQTYEGAYKVISLGKSDSTAVYFLTKEEFLENIASFVTDGDTILIKASRGMGFEEITKAVKKSVSSQQD